MFLLMSIKIKVFYQGTWRKSYRNKKQEWNFGRPENYSNVLMIRSNAALELRQLLWPFVNKIEWSVINFSRPIFLSSHFAKFWNKNVHTMDTLLFNINVIFLPLDCGLFVLRYSLSSADKMEEGKDMFECQIYV